MKRLKQFLIKLIVSISILFLIVFFIISTSPIIEESKPLSSSEVKKAKITVKELRRKFASTNTFIDFSLSQRELDSVMAVATHTIPQVRFNAALSPFGMTVSASKKINARFMNLFINVHCLLSPSFERFEIDYCDLGSIPLPGWLIKSVIQIGTKFIFGNEVEETLTRLLDSGHIEKNKIIFSTTKTANFKDNVNASMKTAAKVIRSVNKSDEINNDRVQKYIQTLQAIEQPEKSLSFYIGKAFAFARKESVTHDPVIENTAALWALAIVYSNPRFAKFIDLKDVPLNGFASPNLRGRNDLNLHFLYSIILEQLGEREIALNVGELKELLDSNKGGSGYSFADLAADKAGSLFSEKITSSNEEALKAQKILANITNEDSFFPHIHDLAEGFKGNEFEQIFGEIKSPLYNKQVARISKRINQLALYQPHQVLPKENLNSPSNFISQGTWLSIDTHIHTKYSDGNKTVAQIASKANEFGCDAIAITDHGDYNLNKVATQKYFDVINIENNKYPYMTILPGLEWNIPPFMGREHATVLLPKHGNSQRDLKAFKDRYDSWGRRSKKLLDTKQAFDWLKTNAIFNNIKPVVIYNHPSRKDKQQSENKHDIEEWSNFSDLVIGFSGAPGHQRNRGKTNGAYNYKHKTIHGWDPSIAKTGTEWDQLLQQGRRVWAARAASDFHSSKEDFWPCQFSSTHLYSRSNEQNDILLALRAGNFWAQHGKFVKHLSFTVQNSVEKSEMGQVLTTPSYGKVTVNLTIDLNDKDWQNYTSSLDEIELVIITPTKIKSKLFEPLMHEQGSDKKFSFNYQHIMDSTEVTFRWRGRSVQPEKHHYMFYTNPIRVITKKE